MLPCVCVYSISFSVCFSFSSFLACQSGAFDRCLDNECRRVSILVRRVLRDVFRMTFSTWSRVIARAMRERIGFSKFPAQLATFSFKLPMRWRQATRAAFTHPEARYAKSMQSRVVSLEVRLEAGIKFHCLNSLSFNLITRRCRSGDESQSWRGIKAFCSVFRPCNPSLKIWRIHARERSACSDRRLRILVSKIHQRLPPCFLPSRSHSDARQSAIWFELTTEEKPHAWITASVVTKQEYLREVSLAKTGVAL